MTVKSAVVGFSTKVLRYSYCILIPFIDIMCNARVVVKSLEKRTTGNIGSLCYILQHDGICHTLSFFRQAVEFSLNNSIVV